MPTRCAVLGDPIEHSLSPVLHRAAYAELGLDWTYDAVRVPSRRARGVRRRAGRRVARAVADDAAQARGRSPLLDLARRLGRVCRRANTLLLDADGGRHGLNTDVPGAIAALREATDAHAATERVVLGGGATATSVLLALAELGLRRGRARRPRPGPGGRDARGGGAGIRARARLSMTVLLGRPRRPCGADVVVSTIPADGPDRRRCWRPWPTCRWSSTCVYDPWPTPLGRPRPRRRAARSSAGSTCCCGRRSTRCAR